MVGYATLAFGLGVGLGSTWLDRTVDATSTVSICADRSSGSSISSTGSDSGSVFFAFVDLVVLARFGFVVLAAPFRLAFVVAVEAVDMTDIVLTSIDSSISGMSIILPVSESIVVLDWVDNRLDAFEVRDALEARPFFALGRLDGAVLPAKWKKGQVGDLR
jgi:hypothetical protein